MTTKYDFRKDLYTQATFMSSLSLNDVFTKYLHLFIAMVPMFCSNFPDLIIISYNSLSKYLFTGTPSSCYLGGVSLGIYHEVTILMLG